MSSDFWREEEDGGIVRFPVHDAGKPRIILGNASPELRVWRASSDLLSIEPEREILALRLTNIQVNSGDDAKKALEQYGVAALIQLERAFGFEARLSMVRPFGPIIFSKPPPPCELTYPEFTANAKAAGLYWTGLQADLPLSLRFLAFYWVLEFFFDSQHKSKELAEQDGFTTLERWMLWKVICNINTSKLRDIILSDAYLKSWYTDSKKQRRVVGKIIDLQASEEELLKCMAERLYAIRNEIVHKKKDQMKLEPLREDANLLWCDTSLMRHLARLALDKWGEPIEAKR